jgi:alpha-tubulin suppressor-like RCC1 family protein
MIDAGGNHTCAVTATGGAQCWGLNLDGVLGNGTNTSSNVPVDVNGRTSLTAAISAGVSHICAITTAGAASCWGDGDGDGRRLGNNDGNSSNVPVPVNGLTTGTTAISAGLNHTCAVNAGGARCWGRNSYGQLGNGNTTGSNVPVNVTNLTSGVATISVGWDTSCAVTTSGGAKCWGDNTYRGIGNGTNLSSSLPVDVTGLTSGVSTVSAGVAHTCAITTAYVAKVLGLQQRRTGRRRHLRHPRHGRRRRRRRLLRRCPDRGRRSQHRPPLVGARHRHRQDRAPLDRAGEHLLTRS